MCVTALLFLQKVLASVDEGGAQGTGVFGFLLLKQPRLHKPLYKMQRHIRYRIMQPFTLPLSVTALAPGLRGWEGAGRHGRALTALPDEQAGQPADDARGLTAMPELPHAADER